MDEQRVFETFPILTTPRLVLRELRCETVDSDDVTAAHAILADPRVMRYTGRHPHTSLEESRLNLERNRRLFENHAGLKWAITRRGDDRLIGTCGHWRLLKEHNRSEIGYELAPELWGQGLMTEALRAILRYGFVEMQLHSTEAQTDPENRRSRILLERLGFQLDGVRREDFYFEGVYYDTACYTLLAREFQAKEVSAK